MTSLDRIASARAFASVQTGEELVRMYVSSGQFVKTPDGERPEVQLYKALRRDGPQRLHVVGPSGAGKTGMILRVLGDLSALSSVDRPYETLVLNVGADPDRLASDKQFMRGVVQQIAVQEHLWASVDQDRLREAAADERTVTGRQVEHRGGVSVGVSYQAALKESYTAAKFGDNVDQARKDLEDVLKLVSEARRPLIVVDDTERFVAARNGEVDVDSVSNLYSKAIRALTDFDVDLVVAMHPHFEKVGAVTEVTERFLFERIDVPKLPAAEDAAALAVILQRRIDRHGISAVADEAARLAVDAQASTIETSHVQPVLDRLPH